MPYQYREDIAHSDVAFDAWGGTLEEVFGEAARATMQVMVEDLSGIGKARSLEVKLEEESAEMLLFDFLNELLFHKDAERLLLLPGRLSIEQRGDSWRLRGTLAGEEIDPGRHRLDTDVKAVTMLRFSLKQVQEGWRATVVLDV